jgi:hypothetical protein
MCNPQKRMQFETNFNQFSSKNKRLKETSVSDTRTTIKYVSWRFVLAEANVCIVSQLVFACHCQWHGRMLLAASFLLLSLSRSTTCCTINTHEHLPHQWQQQQQDAGSVFT